MLLNIGATSLLLRTDQNKKKTCNVSTRPSLRTPLNFASCFVIYIPIFPYSLLCPFLNILLSSPFPHDLYLPIDPPLNSFPFSSHFFYLDLYPTFLFLFPFFLSRSVSHFPLIRYRLTVLILPSCELFWTLLPLSHISTSISHFFFSLLFSNSPFFILHSLFPCLSFNPILSLVTPLSCPFLSYPPPPVPHFQHSKYLYGLCTFGEAFRL